MMLLMKVHLRHFKSIDINKLKILPQNIVICLAGNKCDLIEKEKVTEDRAREFAKEMNALYESTSTDKNKDIDLLFQNLKFKYIAPNLKVEGTSSNEIQNKLNKENNTKKSINKNVKLDDKKHIENNTKKKEFC